jgi:nucleoside-diphosphate-sugar epimerase
MCMLLAPPGLPRYGPLNTRSRIQPRTIIGAVPPTGTTERDERSSGLRRRAPTRRCEGASPSDGRASADGAPVRYLVTGGAGFIGSHLVEALIDRGDSVLVLDNLSTGRLDNLGPLFDHPNLMFVRGSVVDASLVRVCMKTVDCCFHLASSVGVALIVEQGLDSLLNNIRGTDVVLAAAARSRRHVVFTSTSEVYGKMSGAALEETADRILGSPALARWGYAISKEFGEAAALGYAREQELPAVVARLFNVVGPRQSDAYGMVMPRLVRQALSARPLTVFGDGTQSRCFMHVSDAVAALLGLADTPAAYGRIVNVGNPESVRIIDLAERVIRRANSASPIMLIPYDQAYGPGFEELGSRRPDTSALRELLGWGPVKDLDQAIDDVIAHESFAIDRGRGAGAGPPGGGTFTNGADHLPRSGGRTPR